MEFIHLHTHTKASPGHGALTPADLCVMAAEAGSAAVAITDHGNLFAVPEFCRKAEEYGIKPIVGCEFLLHHRVIGGGEEWQRLILLAASRRGYGNLVALVTAANAVSFQEMPAVSMPLLFDHHEGLIVLFGCRHGQFHALLSDAQFDHTLQRLREFSAVFGPNRFYLELQANGPPELFQANARLLELAEAVGAPVVATANVEDEDRYPEPGLESLFAPDSPAVVNTLRIADMCNRAPLAGARKRLRSVPSQRAMKELLAARRMVGEGLKKRLDSPPKPSLVASPMTPPTAGDYQDRLERELETYASLDLGHYLVNTAATVEWARSQGALFAPASGIRAGSLVHYALGVSSLDPLLWELPDAATCPNHREAALETVLFSSAVDVCAMRRFCATLPGFQEAFVARLRDAGFGQATLSQVRKVVPAGGHSRRDVAAMIRFVRESEHTEEMRHLYRTYRDLVEEWDGMAKGFTDQSLSLAYLSGPATKAIPTCKDAHSNTLAQYPLDELVRLGNPCIRWRRLEVLDSIRRVAQNLEGDGAGNIEDLPLDDPAVFRQFVEGDLSAFYRFGFESTRRQIKLLAPTTIEELAMLLALDELKTYGTGGPLEPWGSLTDTSQSNCPTLLRPLLEKTGGRLIYRSQLA